MTNLEEVINKAVEKSVKAAILAAHPVGSYYFSDDDTDPSLILGGGWRRVKGFFLWGRNTDDSTQTVGLTGGEYVHTLSQDEIPAHHHRLKWTSQDTSVEPAGDHWCWVLRFGCGRNEWAYEEVEPKKQYETVGSSQPHNNMPPYRITNLWQRIS